MCVEGAVKKCDVPVDSLKAYEGGAGIALLILNL